MSGRRYISHAFGVSYTRTVCGSYGSSEICGVRVTNLRTDARSTVPGLGASEYQVFGVELLTSTILILALLHFFVQNNEKELKGKVAADEKVGPILTEETGPFAIGLIMSALCLVSSQMSGGSMNPFRSISSAYVSDIWTSQWVYCAAPMTAAVLAASIAKATGTFRS